MSEIGQKLIEGVKKAAADDPDFVYQGPCNYVVDGKPGCIVGKAAWEIGLIDADFQDTEANTGGVDDLVEALDLALTRYERIWLAEAQDVQDCRQPWGIVPDEADRRADVYDFDDPPF